MNSTITEYDLPIVTDDIVPEVRDGLIIWTVGNIEYTVTNIQRDSDNQWRAIRPAGKKSYWRLINRNKKSDENFQPMMLKQDQIVWWRLVVQS
jgi:hypothetical protein